MEYRADVDGLRAIAVSMVVLYHAGFTFIPGGYIGVDIFFVISGFLITNIIYSETQRGTFTFVKFYKRRILRILPAFNVMGFTTLIAGYFLLLPSDLESLSKSFRAATLFFSNIFFWNESDGYFAANTEEMPMLHTWSLSIEEQFYFIWPTTIIVMSLLLPKNKMFILIMVAIIFSFGIAEWGVLNKPIIASAAYYLLPTRAGELLLGAILVFLPDVASKWKIRNLNIISIIGLFLLLAPSLILSKQSAFPGLNSFFPCLGAALIIFSGQNKEVISAKILSLKPAVFIGLISYSLYLWHWPLIAYTKYLQIKITTLTGFIIITTASVLATLSWKYVELPFRHYRSKPFLPIFSIIFLLPCLIVISINNIILDKNGFGIKDNEQSIIDNVFKFPSFKNGWCYHTRNRVNIPVCTIGNRNGDINALLWGDSHAGHYQPFIDEITKNTRIKVTPLNAGNCLASIEDKAAGITPELCQMMRQKIVHDIKDNKYTLIIIAGSWRSINNSFRSSMDEVFDAIKFSSKYAKKVIVFGQVPYFEQDIGSIYARAIALPNIIELRSSYETDDIVIKLNNEISEFTNQFTNVDYIDINDLLLKNGDYYPFSKLGVPLYKDNSHLNINGSKLLAARYMNSKEGKRYLSKLTQLLYD